MARPLQAPSEVRAFCYRAKPPTVVLSNMFDAPLRGDALDRLETDVGVEMNAAYGRVLDCEALGSCGVVRVYFENAAAAPPAGGPRAGPRPPPYCSAAGSTTRGATLLR